MLFHNPESLPFSIPEILRDLLIKGREGMPSRGILTGLRVEPLQSSWSKTRPQQGAKDKLDGNSEELEGVRARSAAVKDHPSPGHIALLYSPFHLCLSIRLGAPQVWNEQKGPQGNLCSWQLPTYACSWAGLCCKLKSLSLSWNLALIH